MFDIVNLILKLDEIRTSHNADGIKVYFNDPENYCIKIIKDEKIIKSYKHRTDSKTKGWDLKK